MGMTTIQAAPQTRLNVMTKPIGSACNLDCNYCYYLSKEELLGHEKGCATKMEGEALEHYIKSYIEQQNYPTIIFHWQGGEPTLLGVDYFREVIRLQEKYRPAGVTIENNLQTNGTLLNDTWGSFLAENNVLVGLSIDGPEMIHNAYRTNLAGRGSYTKVMKGIEVLQRHKVNFASMTCVNNLVGDNALEVYRFLRDTVKPMQMQFIPIVEPTDFRDTAPQTWDEHLLLRQGDKRLDPSHEESYVESWCVSDKQWGDFLTTIFDEWFKNDYGKVFIPYFDACVESWMGRINPLCTLSPMCGKGLAIEHNGDVFSCDHYVYPEFKLGNINDKKLDDMQFSMGQSAFGMQKETSLPEQCRKCPVQFACYGECPKNRFIKTKDGEVGLNYLCAGWKKFFTHIDKPMIAIVNSLGYPAYKQLNAKAMAYKLF